MPTNFSHGPTPGSPRDRDNQFYHLLAGGARTRVLETFLELGLPELLAAEGQMTAEAICEHLSLQLHRGWKFLHLLALSGMLVEDNAELGRDDATFRLSPEAIEFFGEDGKSGYFFGELVQYWRNVAELPLLDVLRGMPLPKAVKWPPPGLEQAEHLETWMTVTAEGSIRTIVASEVMKDAKRLLDVGGGDGTIACALAEQYHDLDITVFNLPASAYIARRTICEKGTGDRVRVHEGDFLADELPEGFDRIMFSRVLTDWAPDVCSMLIEKGGRALAEDGRLIINEALVDGNLDYAISWEFRYIFYDTFGRAVFKPLQVYRKLLENAGFKIVRVAPMLDSAFYSVVEAKKAD